MESIYPAKLNDRSYQLEQWLSDICQLGQYSITAMQGDASFRRYYRIQTNDQLFVVMDAPPPQENCRPFVKIANGLRKLGLKTPEIIHADLENGFLLLTDFGDATYLKTLNINNADDLYERALNALVTMQACRKIEDYTLPPFNTTWMQNEWAWHKEWFLQKWLGLSLGKAEAAVDQNYQLLVESAVNQPQVFMHRDYHSANLMVIPSDVGILDFQDAFIGPITYDLASLLRDCYIDWPADKVEQWALYYLKRLQSSNVLLNVKQQEFLRWFDLMGLQRHIKALLTFARKHVRDGQSNYLQHVPRTLNYILTVSQRYPELNALHQFMLTVVKPKLEQTLCEQ